MLWHRLALLGPLAQALETQIALTECEDETGKAKSEQLMISAVELAELVGARPAILLLRAHGARRSNPTSKVWGAFFSRGLSMARSMRERHLSKETGAGTDSRPVDEESTTLDA